MLRRPVLVVLFLSAASIGAADVKTVGDFSLTDPRTDQVVRLSGLKDRKAVVVVFLGTECPINNAFLPELARLHAEFSPRGVAFLGINSNTQDSAASVASHAKKNAVPFPVLKDVAGTTADRFTAERTPEAFVLDAGGRVLYRGRIDDQFGIGYQRPGKPTRRDLAVALGELLDGKPVTVASTPVAGCRIGRPAKPEAKGTVTYSRHVAPILQKNCQECHRPGQIGPMSLLTYKDAAAWGATIREVIDDGRMPPWFADPKHGTFKNDRRLKPDERKALLAWIDDGMPEGDRKDLPTPLKFPDGWRIGTPDLVVKMPKAFDVPSETPRGGVPYKYFVVDPELKEDKWVTRAEARPEAASVVHHILVFILAPGERYNPDNPGQTLCGTAPGDMPLILPDGMAKKLPKGSRLLFQMHYTPNGKAQSDQSSVGLMFAKEAPKHRVLTKPIYNRNFIFQQIKIPAGDGNFAMESSFTFDRDSRILTFMPHMHLRGKSFRYEAVYPDGRKEVLLNVPRYNFNWQSSYRFAEPKAMPKGTKLNCYAVFDNSAKNPHNPDPTTDVFWGDQTWQEMMVGWMDYCHDKE